MAGEPRRGVLRSRLRRARYRVWVLVAPPEGDRSEDRPFMVLGHRVRMAILFAAIATVPLFSDSGQGNRTALAALTLFGFGPYVFLVGRWSIRNAGWWPRIALMVGDALVVFAFSVAVPETRIVALFGYLLLVAFHTFIGGVLLGIAISALVVPLAVTAEVVASDEVALNAYTLAMYAGVLVILAVIVEAATRERRRSARFLSKLQQAISEVPAAPDLSDTLDSVCRAARRAVDAKFASVLVRDQDQVVQGALEGDHDPDPAERSSEIIQRILDNPMRSPSGVALVTGERVVVPEVALDERFAHWTDETQRQGFTSTIAVPLRTGDDVVGVLAAYFSSPALATNDTADLLTAYADHVTLVILRALAFEHEKNAARRLSEADAIKSELVATVSHELRTPLTAVKGFVETVVRHWERFDDDERKKLLERALGNADQLADMIDTVLDFSRVEAGMVEITTEPIELDAAVPAILETSSHLVDRHAVITDIEDGLVAAGDRDGLGHVLTNLLSNAAKYSDPGSPIRVSARRRGSEAVLSVADAGRGIPAAEQEHIFERFYRGQPGEGPRGTGVGLAVVKRYAEMMGGSVELQSEPDRGSTFSLVLPLWTAADQAEADAAAEVAADAAADAAATAVNAADATAVP